MKIETVKYTITLTLIIAAAAILLTSVNRATVPVIAERKESRLSEYITELLPGAVHLEPEAKRFGYRETPQTYINALLIGFGEDDGPVGCIVEAESTRFSGSNVKMLVGIDMDFEVTGVKILEIKGSPVLRQKVKDAAVTDGINAALELAGKAFDETQRTEIENELVELEQDTDDWVVHHDHILPPNKTFIKYHQPVNEEVPEE